MLPHAMKISQMFAQTHQASITYQIKPEHPFRMVRSCMLAHIRLQIKLCGCMALRHSSSSKIELASNRPSFIAVYSIKCEGVLACLFVFLHKNDNNLNPNLSFRDYCRILIRIRVLVLSTDSAKKLLDAIGECNGKGYNAQANEE